MLNSIGFIDFNGGYYVEGEKWIIETLFKPIYGCTASGYFVRKDGVITFYNPRREKVGEIIEEVKND